jgi:predicted metal-dependent hydrolase
MSSKQKNAPRLNAIPDYSVKVTKKKGIHMRVSARGELVVHANPFMTKQEIDQFVLTHLDDVFFRLKEPTVRLFGKSFRIRQVSGKTNHVSTCDNELILQTKEGADQKAVFDQFIRQYAKEVLEDIASMIILRFKEYQLTLPDIKVRTMKSSWGVCHPEKNSVTLNFELVHYPVEFVEYVICHEFVHLLEPNHSEQFYAILNKVMPDYKRRIDLIEICTEKQYLM